MAIAAVLKTAVRKDFWVRIPGPPLHGSLDTGRPTHTSGTHDIPAATRLCLAPPRRTRDISRSLGVYCRPRGDVAERLKATVC